jgi:hypothetical protein
MVVADKSLLFSPLTCILLVAYEIPHGKPCQRLTFLLLACPSLPSELAEIAIHARIFDMSDLLWVFHSRLIANIPRRFIRRWWWWR